jgi:chaperonin GroES
MKINARFLKGPGGQGACSVTEHGTIKKVTSKRRRSDDRDHVEEQLDSMESSQEKTMFKPLQDRIVIKQAEADEKIGSIIVPTQAQEKPLEGTVIAVGPGRVLDTGERIACSVKEGDVVLFTKFSGTEIEIEGATHLIVREGDILGIMHKEE